jgi:hypothetical protein
MQIRLQLRLLFFRLYCVVKNGIINKEADLRLRFRRNEVATLCSGAGSKILIFTASRPKEPFKKKTEICPGRLKLNIFF